MENDEKHLEKCWYFLLLPGPFAPLREISGPLSCFRLVSLSEM